MTHAVPLHPLTLLSFPYQALVPVTGGRRQLRAEGRAPGSALVWHLRTRPHEQDLAVAASRPGGLPLIVILPPLGGSPADPALARAVESARPLAVLPHDPDPAPEDLASVLRKPPEDLGVEITDYMAWRGIPLDRETVHLVRRIVALSADLRSISATCRSLYLSRRALGRRFVSRGLPVPSHWLHAARLLRVAIRLQNTDDSVLSVGFGLGYPDAFSLSNQMVRLTGIRPTEARGYLGWEWIFEAWLRREADTGGLSPDLTRDVLAEAAPAPRTLARRPGLRLVAEARPGRPGRGISARAVPDREEAAG